MVCMTPACLSLFWFDIGGNWLALPLAGILFALGCPSLGCLFFICMQAVRGNPTWVWDSFRKAYAQEAKKGILLGILLAVLWAGLMLAVSMVLSGTAVGIITFVMLVLAGVLVGGFTFFSLQQLGTVDLPLGGILRNGILLIFAGKLRSLVVSALTLALVLAGAWFSYFSYFLLILGGLGILVMTGELIFYPVFEDLFLDKGQEE